MSLPRWMEMRAQVLRGKSPALRTTVQIAADALSWMFALVVATVGRYEFETTQVSWASLFGIMAATILVQFVVGWLLFLYRNRHPFGSFAEVLAVVESVAITAVVIAVPVLLFGTALGLPRSVVVLAAPIATVLMCGARYIVRLLLEQARRPGSATQRTLVYGSGYLGGAIIRRMMTDRESRYVPVAIIDDSPTRRNARLHGVPVMGTRSDLVSIAARMHASALIVAIGNADAQLLREIADAAAPAELQVKVFPPLEELLEGRSRLRDVRDISIEDLIGRHPVDTDVESVAGYLEGKRVLVTGAGGSIGSELCRQIHKFRPRELIFLDHDETGLQATQIGIRGDGLLTSDDVVLASIRDAEALRRIFAARRPEVVFHAAALKHLPILEQYPEEAWQTNVLGTLNVLEAAISVDVETFVNISTDKAANPISVLGHSKRTAEQLTAWAAERTGARYLSVRFGNVIGSRGSMLPTFTALIEAGGPLTVTHPDVTRYFMTIPEACQLVVQAGGIGRGAEVLILDMGEPVRILDVAQRMIDMSGSDVAIVFTGLREGEKLHEDLVGLGETEKRPVHPKISHSVVPPLAPGALDEVLWRSPGLSIRGRT